LNSFDVVVVACLIGAMAFGFRAGLLRSAATILAYLVAMPIAVWVTGMAAPHMAVGTFGSPQSPLLFFAAFVIAGVALSALLRMAVNDMIGPEIGLGDRLGGAVLGAVRVGLVAVTLVLIFEQLLPANAQPAYLNGSQLRPWLALAGQRGIRALPPDVTATIDQWKRDHRI
jgi:membrane protein required for colicin V production